MYIAKPTLEGNQALCMISSPYVNSNWSYGPETAKLDFDLCDLDLWPLTLTLQKRHGVQEIDEKLHRNKAIFSVAVISPDRCWS